MQRKNLNYGKWHASELLWITCFFLLSDCRKPEVFDIWNKLMLGKDIGIISVHITRQTYHGQAFSEHWEGAARSPPAERDHTRSITCFPFCELQEDVIKIVRTVAIFYYLVHFFKNLSWFSDRLSVPCTLRVFIVSCT